MRIADTIPPKVKFVAGMLTLIGLALNLVLAVSPLWGGHPVLGWCRRWCCSPSPGMRGNLFERPCVQRRLLWTV